MNKTDLNKYFQSKSLPSSFSTLIKNIIDEEEAYAADELVELCEEILIQLAAVGISIYLNQSNQKEVFNDFLIQLFTSKNNTYNAGPLFRWAAHMIKDIDDKKTTKIKSLFWKKNELNSDIHKLAELRNDVMHGFFILPPERNIQEANNIASVLKKLIDSNIFSVLKNIDFPFLTHENNLVSFNGNWQIDDESWATFKENYDFGKLALRIQYENSEAYRIDQKKLVDDNKSENVNKDLLEFINANDRGAVMSYYRPGQNCLEDYSSLTNFTLLESKYLVTFQNLESVGVNYTQDFLIKRIIENFSENLNVEMPKKINLKVLKRLRKQINKKPIVIVNNIHISLFNSNHILNLSDFLYENDIQLVCFGIHHQWMDKFFNKIFDFKSKSNNQGKELEFVMNNYLRFKGPDKNVSDQSEDYNLLLEIVKKLTKILKDKGSVIVRRFSDKYKYPVEYVNEAVDIISPFYNNTNESFDLDEIDELYDFPKEITESSRVIFSLGRRDTKLELEHKIISNE